MIDCNFDGGLVACHWNEVQATNSKTICYRAEYLMIKKQELLERNSCLNKANHDEPIFVIRAKDALAPATLRLWATMADGVHEGEKIAEAIELAEQMQRWRDQNIPQVATPTAVCRR